MQARAGGCLSRCAPKGSRHRAPLATGTCRAACRAARARLGFRDTTAYEGSGSSERALRWSSLLAVCRLETGSGSAFCVSICAFALVKQAYWVPGAS
jgi:hypothetical protein